MTIHDYLERWGRALFEAPLAASSKREEPPELAEIRIAVLERARAHSYRAGGRMVFPHDLVRVRLQGVEESRYPIFAGRFFRQYLEEQVRNALSDSGCRFPENLRVEVEAIPGLPRQGEEWLVVEAASSMPADTGAAARLVVREGEANVPELRLDKARTNIGRVVDVYRSEGLYRRNDLAFAAETEINATVSREHAHVLHDRATGEYRLFNDRWHSRGSECGLWIVRDGLSREVHRGPRGMKLLPGDEIRFGRAVVVFEAANTAQ